MFDIYSEYDEHLSKVYASEALAKKSTVINYKKTLDRNVLDKRKDDFRALIKK
jgi:hypothetical protein